MSTNIVSTTEIYGKTVGGKVTVAGTNMLSNPIGSGKVLRVSTLLMSNTTGGANADIIVALRRGGDPTAASMYFDGASHLILANNANLTLTGDFTIEAWIYLNSMPNLATIFDARNTGGSVNYLFYVSTNSYYRLCWVDTNGEKLSTIPIYLQRWTHVAVTRASNQFYFHVDGVKDNSLSYSNSSSLAPTASGPKIGRLVDNGGAFFNGYMEDLRISTVARYGNSDFTPALTPFPNADADTVLLLHGDGANNSITFTDNAASPRTILRDNNMLIKTAQSVFQGDETRIAHRITVPANATLATISKENPIYLEEGDRLVCTASTDNRIDYLCSYEEIS
jgi:hypothetical protein